MKIFVQKFSPLSCTNVDYYVYDSIRTVTSSGYDKSMSVTIDYSTGAVHWVSYLSVRLSCRMRFDRYPFDTQRCKFRMGSFAYSHDEQVRGWYDTVQKKSWVLDSFSREKSDRV